MPVYRIYVEKKPEFAAEAQEVLREIKNSLLINLIENVRIINIYDVEGVSRENFDKAVPVIFSDLAADFRYEQLPELKRTERAFAAELLPGQYDQRAESAMQGIAALCGIERPAVKCMKLYILRGRICDRDLTEVKRYFINSMEARECDYELKTMIMPDYSEPDDVQTLDGFTDYKCDELIKFLDEHSLAMDIDDIACCQDYFKSEGRNPTVTEIRMLDTYWSDHCRHTTFLTHIGDVMISTDYIRESYDKFLANKVAIGRGDKPVSLMEIATAAMRKLKADGFIPALDESDEINACSVKIDVDGEPWLLMFKNETHNHPTEIEPFGGGATCLGGAVRDVLSGRSYAYQAMRITGSSDPRLPVADTIPGKLPPRKITTTAAAGYASYGNQIGLAGGLVQEIYHDGYMAKRMELGALIGAAPAENVIRMRPEPGDAVILLGGRTGRDGCGGATGSSKSHDSDSLNEHVKSSAEVPKGNAPEERKIQRLFRNSEAARLIKRCNDFGAGGVSVAIGELADGLNIDLDKIPVKYPGLDGTELAISESQERMAVVVSADDAERFIRLAGDENLEAVTVAEVKAEPRLRMNWKGKTIVDISREFLNSNGAVKHTDIKVLNPVISSSDKPNTLCTWEKLITDINICSQRGLVQLFDSTAGGFTILMPLGGKTQQTPVQAMAAKIPYPNGDTKICSLMSWGFDPAASKQSPYHGAAYAVIDSIAKIVAAGGKSTDVHLSFQEYFEKLGDRPERWGKPFAALLSAYEAQLALSAPSIGGKDSMSGSFEDIDVPPTLVSFAVTTAKTDKIISPEFKTAGNKIMFTAPDYDDNNLPDYTSVKRTFEVVEREIASDNALSVWAVQAGGIAEGILKMCLGNRIGARITARERLKLFSAHYGAFILECREPFDEAELIGETTESYAIESDGVTIDMTAYEAAYNAPLESIFPAETDTDITGNNPAPVKLNYQGVNKIVCSPANKIAKPRIFIPVFPGTHGEYEMQNSFMREGAITELFVIKNRSKEALEESYSEFARFVNTANIVALPGGMSAGSEPEGAAKFIAAFMRNAAIAEAINELMEKRGGLMLGIGDGFNALVKLGLLPYGVISEITSGSPALTCNKIGRYQSQYVYTRIASVKSPWLDGFAVGEVYTAPFSSAQGRFSASEELVTQLIKNGQVAAQYTDPDGTPSMKTAFNPAGSAHAIESILSPDGRIFGKMAHTERNTPGTAVNIPGNKNMPLFKAGVKYFS